MGENVAPTVFISWSHSDPGFTERDRKQREGQMIAFANALRDSGVDADIDLYHPLEDWTRWGPVQVQRTDVVLAVLSDGWSNGWMGRPEGTPGVTAECDVLKSIFNNSRDEFDQRLRIVRLGAAVCAVPGGLDRVQRFDVPDLRSESFTTLVDHLLGRVQYARPTLPADDVASDGSGWRLERRHHESPHGSVSISWPVVGSTPGSPQIQRTLDDFVISQLVAYEDAESSARTMEHWVLPVINNAVVDAEVTLATRHLFSVAFECHYNFPGAATSYQRTFGMIFSTQNGHRWSGEDIFLRHPCHLPSLGQAFAEACAALLGGAASPPGLPCNADFVVSSRALGVCTTRYDVGPGFLGAPIIWIPHEQIARLYSHDFERARTIRGLGH